MYYKTEAPAGDYNIFNQVGYFVGVDGFFVLSAFLLTYRLLIDFENANTIKLSLLRLVQYAIRRFFRIYLVFVVFWTACHYGPSIARGYYKNQFGGYSEYLSGILLHYPGDNHIWAIPLEIKYYFCIPIISFIAAKCDRYWIWLCSFLILLVILFENVNPLNFVQDDFYYFLNAHRLSLRFTIFFTGSILGIFYHAMKKINVCKSFFENSKTQKVIGVILVIMFTMQFKIFSIAMNGSLDLYKHTYSAGLYQAIILFFLLFTKTPTPITYLLNSNYFNKCGKYSFGLYLLHPMAIEVIQQIVTNSSIVLRLYSAHVVLIVALTYGFAYIWFHALENVLMRVANYLCKKIEVLFIKGETTSEFA